MNLIPAHQICPGMRTRNELSNVCVVSDLCRDLQVVVDADQRTDIFALHKSKFSVVFFGFFICFVPIILQLLLLYICVLLSERLAALLCVTGRRVTENAVATDISPLCPTIQRGSLRFRSFKYF